MFGSNALPLPTSFAQEHRPLRLTSDSSRPHPIGQCHFLLLHPSAPNQRCSCQIFQHNRSAPGNLCDCGHPACYHTHHVKGRQGSQEEGLSPAQAAALADKVKRIEEGIQNERDIRDSIILRERQAWEREVRILREALAPFYKSEQEMRRRLIELEDRVEGNYDEQVRIRDRVVAIDDASMALEKRVEGVEQGRGKKRKASRDFDPDAITSSESNDASSSGDTRATSAQYSSRALSPRTTLPPITAPESPRSSGILNLVEMPRQLPQPPMYVMPRPRPLSPPSEEPRSSGFLALDLGERLTHCRTTPNTPKEPSSPEGHDNEESRQSPAGVPSPPPGIVGPTPISLPALLSSEGFVHRNKDDVESRSPKKRKHHNELMALDVLANVSVASPLIR